MSRVNSFTPTTPPPSGKATDLKTVDTNQFLTLMITELQNQDPLNPMDNTQMLQQISQIIGFADQPNFSQFFKKYVGITPNEFRRSPISPAYED